MLAEWFLGIDSWAPSKFKNWCSDYLVEGRGENVSLSMFIP
jgi:hypothetical protein